MVSELLHRARRGADAGRVGGHVRIARTLLGASDSEDTDCEGFEGPVLHWQ